MFSPSAQGRNREADTVALFSRGKERQKIDFQDERFAVPRTFGEARP